MKSIMVPDKDILEESGENLSCMPLNTGTCVLPNIISFVHRVLLEGCRILLSVVPIGSMNLCFFGIPFSLKRCITVSFCAQTK